MTQDIVAAEAYQVIGELARAADLFGHPEVQRALDYFGIGGQDGSILPFAIPDASSLPETSLGDGSVAYAACPFDTRLARTPYLVLPKMAIQAMPMAWRERLDALLSEADKAGLETPRYTVLRDEPEYSKGVPEDEEDPYGPLSHVEVYRPDPWAEYRHATADDVKALSPNFETAVLAAAKARQPGARGRERVPVRDVGIHGPVDGMNNPDPSGSYFRLVLTGKAGEREERRISLGAAEVLLAEMAGLHERAALASLPNGGESGSKAARATPAIQRITRERLLAVVEEAETAGKAGITVGTGHLRLILDALEDATTTAFTASGEMLDLAREFKGRADDAGRLARMILATPSPAEVGASVSGVTEAARALLADLDRTLRFSDYRVVAGTNASVKRLRALLAQQSQPAPSSRAAEAEIVEALARTLKRAKASLDRARGSLDHAGRREKVPRHAGGHYSSARECVDTIEKIDAALLTLEGGQDARR